MAAPHTVEERRGRPWVVGVAFAVAPLGAMLALTALSPSAQINLPFLLGIALLAYPFVAVSMLVIAGPIYVVLRCYGMVNLPTILAGGILTGFLTALVLPHAPGSYLRVCGTMMVAGAAAALVFWLIWRLRKI